MVVCSRFGVDLPQDFNLINAHLLQQQVSAQVQTPEQIEAIVKEARIMLSVGRPNWAE